MEEQIQILFFQTKTNWWNLRGLNVEVFIYFQNVNYVSMSGVIYDGNTFKKKKVAAWKIDDDDLMI